MVRWRIYYGDGSVYDSTLGSPFGAPALNVQAIICRDDDPDSQLGRYLVARFDYYWWDPPDWFGGDIFGLFDYLQRPGVKKVIFGRTIGNPEHQAIIDRAAQDPELRR